MTLEIAVGEKVVVEGSKVSSIGTLSVAISACVLAASCGDSMDLGGMRGYRLASETCVAGEIAFSTTFGTLKGDFAELASPAALESYLSRIDAQGALKPVFRPVWSMSYEYAVKEGSSVVMEHVDPYRQSHPDLAASGERSAERIAKNEYKEFCLFLAGKLIASGKARRDLERILRGDE